MAATDHPRPEKQPAVPRGIEVLVKKAAVDAEFCALLLQRRAEAAQTIGLKLAPAEVMMLDHTPEAQLQAIIAGTRVPPAHIPAFLGKVAAVMLAALGVVTAGCEDRGAPKPAGIRPETQPDSASKVVQPTTQSQTDLLLNGLLAGIRPATTQTTPSRPSDDTIRGNGDDLRPTYGARPEKPPADQPPPTVTFGLRPADGGDEPMVTYGARPIRPGTTEPRPPIVIFGATISDPRDDAPITIFGEMPDRPPATKPGTEPATTPSPPPEIIKGSRIDRPE